jgi:hypothetical protein
LALNWVRKASNETSAKQRKQEDNASQAKDSFDLDKSIDRCGTERDAKAVLNWRPERTRAKD